MQGLRAIFALALSLALSSPAFAYVRTMSTSGRPLAWPSASVSLRGNPLNTSGLSALQVSTAIGDAVSSWNLAGTRVALGYTQSTGFPASSNADGTNAVYFASNGGRSLDWGVVALTEVLYFVSSGQISEADMVFNDNQFLFTNNPGDTGAVVGGHTAIYLRDVATHEAGHVLGLDHSNVNLASLIYTAFNGQYNLSGDEQNAMRTIYPGGGAAGGSFTGLVRGTAGGIFGAQVTAVNLLTGKVEAAGLASSDGSFRLGDVPAGRYAVMMEPFGTDPSTVSSYYQNVSHYFCNGALFRRRFYSACGSSSASVLDSSAGSSVALGTLAPSCSRMGNPGGAPTSLAAAKTLPSQGGAVFGTLSPGDAHYYVVHNVAGALSARAMSYSLYSPVDVKVEILDQAGAALAGAASVDNVDAPGAGGVTNYDSLATANVPNGDYVVKVTAAGARLSASKYSAGWELQDIDGHYLLALAVNGDIAPSGLTDMSSCVSVPNTMQSASFRDSPASSSKTKTAGCGVTSNPDGPFSGGMTQVLALAGLLQLLTVALRLKRRAAIARPRR